MRGVRLGDRLSNKQMKRQSKRLLKNQNYHGTQQWLLLQRQVHVTQKFNSLHINDKPMKIVYYIGGGTDCW